MTDNKFLLKDTGERISEEDWGSISLDHNWTDIVKAAAAKLTKEK